MKQGVATGASDRNWKGYGHEVDFQGEDWKRKLLSDPQTSGGLLVACAPEAEKAVLGEFAKAGLCRSAYDRPPGRRAGAASGY